MRWAKHDDLSATFRMRACTLRDAGSPRKSSSRRIHVGTSCTGFQVDWRFSSALSMCIVALFDSHSSPPSHPPNPMTPNQSRGCVKSPTLKNQRTRMTCKSFSFFRRVFRWSIWTYFCNADDFSHSLTMQRTASKAAIDVFCVCPPHLDCVARFSELAVADLVSR